MEPEEPTPDLWIKTEDDDLREAEIQRLPVDARPFYDTSVHRRLMKAAHRMQSATGCHTRNLLLDKSRNDCFLITAKLGETRTPEDEDDKAITPARPRSVVTLDMSRQAIDKEIVDLLLELAEEMNVREKIRGAFGGKKLNTTEDREALHTALRGTTAASVEVLRWWTEAPVLQLYHREDDLGTQLHEYHWIREDWHEVTIIGDTGMRPLERIAEMIDIMPEVHSVKFKALMFADAVRSGKYRGHSGRNFDSVLCVGVGALTLGPECFAEALRMDPEAHEGAKGRNLRFLSSADPTATALALEGLNPETTVTVIVSKCFKTRETLMHGRYLRQWYMTKFKDDTDSLAKHMLAVTASPDACAEFGIHAHNIFGFWDFVGDRFSVASSVGVLPLSLHFGRGVVERFIEGLQAIDRHVLDVPFARNIPVLMALMSVWNSTYMDCNAVAILPYPRALFRFPAYIQNLLMASTGKSVDAERRKLPENLGEIYLGQASTTADSFTQMLQQGHIVPSEHIGFIRSQYPLKQREGLSNEDLLMSKFFSLPDALAQGVSYDELRAEGIPESQLVACASTGQRPSQVLLLPILNSFNLGCLMGIYEHRAVVQGYIWGINPFDNMGIELGDEFATNINDYFALVRANAPRAHRSRKLDHASLATRKLLRKYMLPNFTPPPPEGGQRF